jgi:gas vesicle protein
MRNATDRNNEQNGNDGGGFVLGLLTGAVLGAGLGMLFAPKAGAELRRRLGEQAENFANNASAGYQKASDGAAAWAGKAQESAGDWANKASDAADEAVERGKDLYGKAREAVAKGTDEAQRYVQEASAAVNSTATSISGGSTGPRRG